MYKIISCCPVVYTTYYDTESFRTFKGAFTENNTIRKCCTVFYYSGIASVDHKTLWWIIKYLQNLSANFAAASPKSTMTHTRSIFLIKTT